jgi:hypothetical protein
MLRHVALLVVMTIAAPAIAGTMFRLEIGPPVAAGTGSTVTTQFKKNVVLVVRPRVQISGTAEGLVNGARQSISLNLIPVDPAEGVYAALQQWPAGGHWLLQLNGSCPSPKASASTLVPMNGSTFIRETTQVLREPATHQQVEAALAALVRSQLKNEDGRERPVVP